MFNLKIALKSIQEIILNYIKVNSIVESKYGLSKYQKDFGYLLFNLKDLIKKSKIIKLLETLDKEVRKNNEFIEFRNVHLDSELNKILNFINKIEENLNFCLRKKGLFKSLIAFFFDDTFGSPHQLRTEITSKYCYEEVRIKLDEKKNIFTDVLILHYKRNSNSESRFNNNLNLDTSINHDQQCITVEKNVDSSSINSNISGNSSKSQVSTSKISLGNLSYDKSHDNNTNNNQQQYDNSIISNNTNTNNNSIPENKNLMILCGPNAVPYEISCINNNATDFFLNNKCDVLLWNYRGYGESKGSTSLENIKHDLKTIIENIQVTKNYENIGVYGLSIGSIPSCFVAGEGLVKLCYIDRGFSSIDEIVKSKFNSTVYTIYKALFIPKVKNVLNFVKANCPKILSCDCDDEIIPNEASLKSGISNEIVGYLKAKDVLTKSNSLIESVLETEADLFVNVVVNLLRIINSTLSNASSELYNQDLFNSSQIMPYTNINSNKLSLNDSILSEEKINFDRKNKPSIKSNQSNTKNNINTNNNNNNNNINKDISSPKYSSQTQVNYSHEFLHSDENYKSALNEQETVLKIKQTLEKLDAAGESLLKINPEKNILIIKNNLNTFFSNLLIWGSYHLGTVIATDKNIIFKALLKKINIIIAKLKRILENKNQRYCLDNASLKDNLRLFVKFLVRIESVYNKIIFKNYDEIHTKYKLDSTLNISDDNLSNSGNVEGSSLGLDGNTSNITSSKNESNTNTNMIMILDSNEDEKLDENLESSNKEINSKSMNNNSNFNDDIIKINEIYNNLELSNFIKKNNIGNLVPITCGHNGLLTEKEYEIIRLYMVNAGFIK